MDNSINSDLIRGHINTIILKALYEGDRYGYDIIKDIEQKSSGQYQLKQPTLYSCLKRLETQGFISSYWGAKSNGGRRKYYALTDMGRELFIQNQTEWEYSRTVIDKLISDKRFDLSAVAPALSDEETERDSTAVITEERSDDESEEEETADESETETPAADTESEPTEEPTNAESMATAETPPVTDETLEPEKAADELPREYVDTAAYFRRLFGEKRSEAEETSYSEKLADEHVEPSPRLQADDFFRDFTDEYDEPETPLTAAAADAAPEPTYERPVFFASEEPAETPVYTPTPAPEPAVPPEEPADDTGFLRYDTPVDSYDERDTTIRREYRSILSEMLTPPAQPPVTEEDVISEAPAAETTAAPATAVHTDRRGREDDFERLASSVKDLGDGIVIRTHSSAAAKTYYSENYYYSNKLMLHHYAILFGLCLFEIIVMFLAMTVGFGVKQYAGSARIDLILYGLAVAGSLAFPITAAVRNYLDPYKRKRSDFNLKSSLIFRSSLTLILLVLVYLINLCCGMKLTSTAGYEASLTIPMVMAFNFIFSTLIFNLLYTSKKYAVEE